MLKLFLLVVSCLSCNVAAKAALRVVTELSPPHQTLVAGEVAGLSTELVRATLAKAGVTAPIEIYPWARSFRIAQSQPDVLIYNMARTAEREPQFHWAGEIMQIQYHLYRLKRRLLDVTDLASARAYTIGVMRDDVRQQYLRSRGFEKLVVSAQPLDNFRKLLSGQVDLVPLTTDDAAMLCKETGFDCADLQRVLTLDEATTGLYMAYSRQTPLEVVQRTRQAFERLKAEGVVKRTMERGS